MNDHQEFLRKCAEEIAEQGRNRALLSKSKEWFLEASKANYSYHFEWLGRPIIQFPTDIIATQQILWRVQPDLVIETGIARGGSLIFYASMLELIAQCGGPVDAKVLGIDIDIRQHNKEAIQSHPMSKRIQMIEGSSTSLETISDVRRIAQKHKRILVCLDSNHTHDHVLEELKHYAPLVSRGSYCIVFDTVIEDMPDNFFPNRPWRKGNNAKTAVLAFLDGIRSSATIGADGHQLRFEIDKSVENQIQVTVAPDGYLYRV